jgi:hypothetical protein
MPIRSLSIAPVFCYTGRGRVYESNATRDLPFSGALCAFQSARVGAGAGWEARYCEWS